MRAILAALPLFAACATDPAVTAEPGDPVDALWAASLHAGDLIAMVPGTGSYDYIAAPIEALGVPNPLVDPRVIPKVASDAIVFEQAIAAAHRAGIDPSTLSYGLWGAGFTTLDGFDYLSYEGIRIHVAILGGANSCTRGLVAENLLNYTPENAERDARDLHARITAYAAAHGIAEVVVASHSWGGAVAEYLAMNREAFGLTDGPPVSLTIAAGVPAYVPNYVFAGPGLRDLPDSSLYEVDRPDDPVHAMNPSGNPDGHQYVILYGDAFQGSYGITTDELSCKGVPGACPLPQP